MHKERCVDSAKAQDSCLHPFPIALLKIGDFATFPRSSQAGTVRLSLASSVGGVTTTGMSACIALIFTSAEKFRLII